MMKLETKYERLIRIFSHNIIFVAELGEWKCFFLINKNDDLLD